MYIVTQYRDYRLENCIIYRIIILFFLAVFSWDGGGELFMCLIPLKHSNIGII